MYTGVMIFPYLVRAVLLILGGPAVHGHHLMLHHGRPRGHVVLPPRRIELVQVFSGYPFGCIGRQKLFKGLGAGNVASDA